MRKLVLILALLLLSSNAFAVTRNALNNQENETAFGKVVATGADHTGNPGYIAVVAPDAAGVNSTYYLWIKPGGTLCESSYPVVSAYASFPNGDWRTGMPCTVVGAQSS